MGVTDYDLLVRLWTSWLAQDAWLPLDKWLKNQARSRRLSAAVHRAMLSALRYAQLASALEYSYRTRRLHRDWEEWDAKWQVNRLNDIPPLGFWYWILLRETTSKPVQPPPALRDSAARLQFFAQAAGQSQTLMGLWEGLRPQWLPLLRARQALSGWGDQQWTGFVQQQSTTPPVWLRAQRGAEPAHLAKALAAEGVEVCLDHQGLRACGGKALQTTACYREGLIEIQDKASQLIAAAVDAQPGEKVWDACAGAGGKSLVIADRMRNKGVVVATDLHAYKLEELKRRAKRAQIYNIRSFSWAGSAPLDLPKEIALHQGFDWVLVDAPCSSSGTWRRNPDARWRFSAEDSRELIALQAQVLHYASVSVRPGGRLVYATCSWQVSENEEQVADFLQTHGEFALLRQALLGAPEMDADTMFVAVLQKK